MTYPQVNTVVPGGSGTGEAAPPDVTFFLDRDPSRRPFSLETLFDARQPVMPFTAEEGALVDRIRDVSVAATRAVEVRPEILRLMMMAAKTGAVMPYKALVEGYTVCLRRIIKFASDLDFFQVRQNICGRITCQLQGNKCTAKAAAAAAKTTTTTTTITTPFRRPQYLIKLKNVALSS